MKIPGTSGRPRRTACLPARTLRGLGEQPAVQEMYPQKVKAIPHNSRLTAQAPLRRLRHGICVAKMLDNVGLRYPHRASGAKAPRTLRPLPLLRFAVSATGGAHLCSIQYYLRFWLSICRTSLAVSALRIMRCCPIIIKTQKQYNSHNGQARCGCCFWCPFSRGKKSVPIYFDCIVDTAIIMPQ